MGAPDLAVALKKLAGRSTADLVGIAPGDAFTAEELGELGQAFGPVRSVVVLAQRIVDPVQTVRFFSGDDHDPSRLAGSFGDAMLQRACWQAVEILQRAGYGAAIVRNLKCESADPSHRISFKKGAVLAGLAAFGKSQLAIHPEWGPWMYLRAVITEAPLPPDQPIEFSPCGECEGHCYQACPSGALTESGIDRQTCRSYVGYAGCGPKVIALSPHGRVNCEECMRACPVGVAPPRLQIGSTP